ncbi:MAG: ABC transporter ATP-binding protein [Gammaproteobacteria bacterium]|nr:ABC transporter ATP-binding protein [Gammaproteobacteria bacterium]
MTAILRTEQLTKWVTSGEQRIDILHPLDLQIQAGESVVIVGPSGSGKSTLMSLLAGIDAPSSGRIWLEQQELTALDEGELAALRRGTISFVFQDFLLLPALTALENVMLPLQLIGAEAPREQAQARLAEVALTARQHHFPAQLSGGEQQRVAVARAYASHPRILFADEPTGNLDAASGEQVIELLFRLNREQGTTLVVVTHDERVAGRAQRRLQLDAGQLLELD